jgi:hypothetical protein
MSKIDHNLNEKNDFLLNNEIIQNVTYDNYHDFQHANFIFSQNFIPLFWRLFNDEIDFRLKYLSLILIFY